MSDGPEVIEDAPGVERPVGRLRLVAAAGVAVACPWLLWASGGAPFAWAVTLLSVPALVFWWRSFARIERQAHERRRFVLGADGVRLEGPGAFQLAWTALDRIEVDHDRLVLRFVPRAGPAHELEPPLGGLGLEALAEQVERARRAAGASPGPSRRP